jgi:preprotein translocase subunit SecA
MGLLSFFGIKRRPESPDDKIWLTDEAKLTGVCAEAKEHLDEEAMVVLVAHFPETLEALKPQLQQAGVEFQSYAELIAGSRQDKPRLLLALAAELPTDTPPAEVATKLGVVSVIVAERYPLRAADERIRAFAAGMPCRSRVQFHLALTDPLVRRYAGPQIGSVLRALGMTDDAAITNRLVSRHLAGTQRAVAAEATGDAPADSAEAWFERNCRETAGA